MDMGAVCLVAKPLGHSWPGPHWWMTLTAADQGAWVSGIGSLAAVFATVILAIAAQCRSRREKEESEQIIRRVLMLQIRRPITSAVTVLGIAQDMLLRLREGQCHARYGSILRIERADVLGEIVQRGTELKAISAEMVEVLFALEEAISRFHAVLDSVEEDFILAIDDPGIGELISGLLISPLNQMYAAVDRAVGALAPQHVDISALKDILKEYPLVHE